MPTKKLNIFKDHIDRPGQLISFSISKRVFENNKQFMQQRLQFDHSYDIGLYKNEKPVTIISPLLGFYWVFTEHVSSTGGQARNIIFSDAKLKTSFGRSGLKRIVENNFSYKSKPSRWMNLYIQVIIDEQLLYVLYRHCKPQT